MHRPDRTLSYLQMMGIPYRGLGGDDTYIISNAVSGSVTIVDTNGANVIQLVDGLSIASSKFASDSVQLTLSNGAVVTINGADQFTFDVGGNKTSGTTGSSNTYAELASAMGVSSLPTGSTITDGTGGTISGTGVTSGATSYSLSASTNSVAEGSAITYTITANAAATADTTFTYNVAGDTNGDTVDKAGSGDTDSLSGTVTLAQAQHQQHLLLLHLLTQLLKVLKVSRFQYLILAMFLLVVKQL